MRAHSPSIVDEVGVAAHAAVSEQRAEALALGAASAGRSAHAIELDETNIARTAAEDGAGLLIETTARRMSANPAAVIDEVGVARATTIDKQEAETLPFGSA